MAEPHSLKKAWISTPLIHSTSLSRAAGCQIYLKLENLQPAGSFKSRGIGNLVLERLRLSPSTSTHFYSSSGGNAGLACVHAAVTLSSAATIVVPLPTSTYMIAKLKTAGATDVIQHGKSWAEADAYLHDTLIPAANDRGENAVYVPPFDAPEIWTGHATLIPEIFEYFLQQGPPRSIGQLANADFDAVVCSVGGGGLICGVMQGLDECGQPNIPVLAMETAGADSLSYSIKNGALSTLPAITSIATTLGARKVAAKAYEYSKRPNMTSVVLEDKDAVFGCLKLADEERFLVEPACGVNVAMCYEGRLKKYIQGFNPETRVVIVVCGGSDVTFERLQKWEKEFS